MVPSSGYWHSSPFSPIIQECLFEKACAFEGREKSLEEFYANRENLLVTAEMSENYTQCREVLITPQSEFCSQVLISSASATSIYVALKFQLFRF